MARWLENYAKSTILSSIKLWNNLDTHSLQVCIFCSVGIDAPRRFGVLGEELPSARVISNELHKADGQSPRNDKLTMMVMQWGQFIDHEFVSTPVMKDTMGANIDCCDEGNENRTECFPIRIPDDDPFYNRTCMSMVRSAPVLDHDCEPGFREQMNQVTSYIDASAIYGSTEDQSISLRAFEGGLLKIYEDNETNSEQLPPDTNDKYTIEAPKDRCALAGDKRVNVVPALGWSHTCFMREHNRIAQELVGINADWDDETIFQQTRRINGQQNYREHICVKYDIIFHYCSIFGDGVRNLLFKDKNGISLDLPSLNIQRGRDHGIPGYNHWRKHCNLGQANMSYDGSFILPDHTEEQRLKIQNIYSHVDDIDLFPGAMTESLLPDSSVGPIFACLLGKQLKKLREGDRYWHETQDPIIKFTNDQLTELRKVSFARVLCDNFDVSQVQPDVFHVPGIGNERVDCDQIQGINLEKWVSCDFLPDGRPHFNSYCRKKRNRE
ncbi:uncharacterized protein LOC132751271 [Ruditapes philippinarum]|uniref:uncharacterized protein LOC132751271 n=1 Tax=Ruditapes philippinarum TaxID=129788 RepID=UPI00295BF466|nr:uncharacterized protein LOC132751271 [Ruditapes philippinarum]